MVGIEDLAGINFGSTFSAIGLFLNDGITQSIIILNLPLWIVWVIINAYLIHALVIQRIAFILPWDYKFRGTKVIPYANRKLGLFPDKCGFARESGQLRFKVKSESATFQKPDNSDRYPNQEYIMASISESKRIFIKRKYDGAMKTLFFSLPKATEYDQTSGSTASQLGFFENLKFSNLNWFYEKFGEMMLIIAADSMITILLIISNFHITYPMLVRNIMGC